MGRVRSDVVVQLDHRTPTGPENESFFTRGIRGVVVVFTFMK